MILIRALEAVFDIGNHILSRVPEAVPESFARENLIKIAGYRNRLIHFYAEVLTITLKGFFYLFKYVFILLYIYSSEFGYLKEKFFFLRR